MAIWQNWRHRRFINALVSDCGLRYREVEPYEMGEEKDRADEVLMPTFNPNMTEAEREDWMDCLITKAFQREQSNRDDFNYIPEGEGLKSIHSVVCDHNTKQKKLGDLIGADEYSARATERRLQSVLSSPDVSPQGRALTAFDGAVRASQGMCDSGIADVLVNSLEGEGKELYDKLMSTCGEEMSQVRESGLQNFELSNKIAEILNIETEEPPPQGGNGEGDDEKGQDSESEETQSSDDGNSQGQEGQGQPEKEQESGADSETCKPDDSLGEGYKAHEMGMNKKMDFSAYESGGRFEPWETEVVVTKGRSLQSGERISDITKKMSNALSTKVRNMLKVMSQAKYVGGKVRGKINKRSLATIPSGNERVFRQKEQRDVLDTSVMLLVDSSGSMGGSKYSHACAATAMLSECLTKLAIPHSVLGFTTGRSSKCKGGRANIIYEHKTFNEKGINRDEIVRRMLANGVELRGNADAEAVMYAHDQLLKTKSKRRILIVLSDGQPANGHNAYEFLKRTCEDIEKSSPCELYGLGIEDDSVKHFYSNHQVLRSARELEESLLELFKSAIIK